MGQERKEVLYQTKNFVAKEFQDGSSRNGSRMYASESMLHGGSRKTSVRDPKHKKDFRSFFNSPSQGRAIKVVYK